MPYNKIFMDTTQPLRKNALLLFTLSYMIGQVYSLIVTSQRTSGEQKRFIGTDSQPEKSFLWSRTRVIPDKPLPAISYAHHLGALHWHLIARSGVLYVFCSLVNSFVTMMFGLVPVCSIKFL